LAGPYGEVDVLIRAGDQGRDRLPGAGVAAGERFHTGGVLFLAVQKESV
jgi:hypothetical protein